MIMVSERIRNFIAVYEEIVKRVDVVFKDQLEEYPDGYAEMTAEEFDKVVNEAFSAVAKAMNKTEGTVRASLTRDIDVTTEELKKGFKDYLTGANKNLEDIAEKALTDKDDRENVRAKLRSI